MKNENKEFVKALSLISQVSISMIVPIFLCAFVGAYVDNKFNTYFMLPLMLIGILAGIRNCYILIKNVGGK